MEDTEDIRVTLAKDVIAALNAKRFNAKTGNYLRIFVKGEGYVGYPRDSIGNRNANAKEAFADKLCSVCAKGALLVAAIDRFDQVRLSELYGSYDYITLDGSTPAHTWLQQWFSRKQLALMEMAFEGRECSVDTENLPHSKKKKLPKSSAIHTHRQTNGCAPSWRTSSPMVGISF